ncbi:hypothetical protein ACWPM1_02585 [Tsuneonella sp. HG249]
METRTLIAYALIALLALALAWGAAHVVRRQRRDRAMRRGSRRYR